MNYLTLHPSPFLPIGGSGSGAARQLEKNPNTSNFADTFPSDTVTRVDRSAGFQVDPTTHPLGRRFPKQLELSVLGLRAWPLLSLQTGKLRHHVGHLAVLCLKRPYAEKAKKCQGGGGWTKSREHMFFGFCFLLLL